MTALTARRLKSRRNERMGGPTIEPDLIRTNAEQRLQVKTRHSLMPWLFFVAAIVVSFFVHELGHCSVAWLHGYPAIPTPAKEYVLKPVPENIQHQVALGGILGSVAALLAAVLWLHRHPTPTCSALLAGAMTAPGFYTLRFVLAGRGHDATEFQEAQAALGLGYSGHAADWLFVSLFLMATAFWFLRTGARPTLRLVGRLAVGAIAALVVVVLLQSINNAVFDPLFQPKAGQNHPLARGSGVGPSGVLSRPRTTRAVSFNRQGAGPKFLSIGEIVGQVWSGYTADRFYWFAHAPEAVYVLTAHEPSSRSSSVCSLRLALGDSLHPRRRGAKPRCA